MTAVTKPQPAAVARADDETKEGKGLDRYAEFGRLPVHARAEVYRAREIRETADMVALTEWGAKLTEVQRVAVAKWCIRRDADPVTELDNVGGPYLNSEYYLRKLGELRVRGVVRDVEQFHIGNDPRLAALAKDPNAPEETRAAAKKEHYRRLELRIKHSVPEEAAAVHVTLLHLAAGGDPIEGVKWGGNGTSVKQPRHGGGSAPNPVVEANPALSVESQSVRRAMRALALKMPSALPEFVDDDTDTPELRPADDPIRALPRGTPLAQPDDPYGEPSAIARDEDERPIPSTTVVERSEAAETATDDSASSAPTSEALDVVTGQPLSGAGAWEIPAGDLRGRKLGTLSTAELSALRESLAEFPKKYGATVARIDDVLEERRDLQLDAAE